MNAGQGQHQSQNQGGNNTGQQAPASGFDIPNTLDASQFPPNAAGGPFFSGGLVPGANAFQGQPYQGNPNGQFKKLNFNKLNNLAIQSALLSQNAAQQAWEQRYPLLAQADKMGITSNLVNISGKHDPFIYNALQQSGLGGVDFGNNAYAQAKNMGNKDILSKEMRDRNYAANIFNNHPITKLGLGPADVYKIEEANTGGLNAFNSSATENAINLANSQAAANQQVGASIIGGLSQIASSGIKAYSNTQNPYLNNSYYQSQYVTSPPTDAAAGAG